MAAVVIALTARNGDGDNEVYGPFDSGDAASSWAHRNITDVDWYWLPLTKPDMPGNAQNENGWTP